MAQLSSTKTKTVKKSKRASGASDARRIQQVREAQARFKARQKQHIETLEQQLVDLTAKLAERYQQAASPVDAPALTSFGTPDALSQPLPLSRSPNDYLSRRVSELETENAVLRSMWIPVMDALAFLPMGGGGDSGGTEDVKPFSNGALSPGGVNVSSFSNFLGGDLMSTSEPVISDFDVKDENSPLGCHPVSLFPALSFRE
ncbi:hypothetical protein BC830DRAFT_1077496 [Chytriomyces sp. MP71]|nr:hypothetical protein BC830DRAFT_1077496 [Chytriomyces sp. MP71]